MRFLIRSVCHLDLCRVNLLEPSRIRFLHLRDHGCLLHELNLSGIRAGLFVGFDGTYVRACSLRSFPGCILQAGALPNHWRVCAQYTGYVVGGLRGFVCEALPSTLQTQDAGSQTLEEWASGCTDVGQWSYGLQMVSHLAGDIDFGRLETHVVATP